MISNRGIGLYLSVFKTATELDLVGEAFDGLEGVQQAQELQPDVILLDLALPGLNGIQAIGRIREISPESRILMMSDTRSAAIAETALASGACGYVVKSDAYSDLLPAIDAALKGEPFFSASLGRAAADGKA